MSNTLQIVLATLAGAAIGAALTTRWEHVRILRADLYLDLLPRLDQSYRDSGFRAIDDALAQRVAYTAIASGRRLRKLGGELNRLVFDYRHPDRKDVIEDHMRRGMWAGTASIASEVDRVATQMADEATYLLQPAATRWFLRRHYRLGVKWPRYRRLFKIPPPRI